MAAAAVALPPGAGYPPLNFFYTHFHNRMKGELEVLAQCCAALDESVQGSQGGEGGVRHGPAPSKLLELRERYRFLEQVYKYHSSVEDEVVYPALDAKVKNVTMAYRVEHQDEEMLLEQCAQLISSAITQTDGQDSEEAVRGIICKVEEIHRTLKKHLAKEEEQLVPLLLQHFTFAEQAALVAQFLYCIPLAMVERVLAWLKPQVPQVEQEELMHHIRSVVPDTLLLQLLTSWLQAGPDARQVAAFAQPGLAEVGAVDQLAEVLPVQGVSTHETNADMEGQLGPGVGVFSRAPLKEILHIHRTICGALEEFALETRNLQQRTDVTALHLSSLVERHRFLRSVCMFHTISEEEVMYPEVRRLAASHPSLAGPDGAGAGAHAACSQCEAEHADEVAALEQLGRLLADVRAYARRGRKEVAQMLARLSSAADQVLGSIAKHMAREEREVLPLLERHLCVQQQRAIVWRTLSAMPLRLLERVLPCVTAGLPEPDIGELLNNIKLGAPEPDSVLVALMARWADRGRSLGAAATLPGAGQSLGGGTCVPPGLSLLLEPSVPSAASPGADDRTPHVAARRASGELGAAGDEGGADGGPGDSPPSKRPRLTGDLGDCTAPGGAVPGGPGAMLQSAGGACDTAPLPTRTSAQPDACTTLYPPPGTDASNGGADVPSSGLQPRLSSGDPTGTGGPQYPVATHAQHAQQGARGQQGPGEEAVGSGGLHSQQNRFNPIDHIFQFHQALRQELRQLEADALRVERAVLSHLQDLAPARAPDAPPPSVPPAAEHAQHAAAAAAQGRGDRDEGATTPHTADVAGGDVAAPAAQGDGCEGADVASCDGRAGAVTWPERCVTPALSGVSAAPGGAQGVEGGRVPRAGTPQFGSTTDVNGLGGQHQHDTHGEVGAGAATTATTVSTTYTARLPKRVAAAIQALDGRFQFLWGIYRAHSRSEDEIVFPALESKQALRNVSHAYQLDHQQEEQLFLDLEQVIDSLRRCEGGARAARDAVLAVRRMCAAMRASLETHIRAEEAELWPLFTEHFTNEEQQYLVGVIIGRTGAQVLQALLPWISESFSLEEKELMMGSLRQATRNTMFDQWLEAVMHQPAAPGGPGSTTDTPPPSQPAAGAAAAAAGPQGVGVSGDTAGGGLDRQSSLSSARNNAGGEGNTQGMPGGGGGMLGPHSGDAPMSGPDPEIARYLHASPHDASLPGGTPGAERATAAAPATAPAPGGATAAAATGAMPAGVAHATVESTTFRPGWEDIFRMNQKQLEAAVMRVSADPNLEPGRKAYLIQNIMVSKYIVAQQKRMQKELSELDGSFMGEEGDALAAFTAVHALHGGPGVGGHGAADTTPCAHCDGEAGGDVGGVVGGASGATTTHSSGASGAGASEAAGSVSLGPGAAAGSLLAGLPTRKGAWRRSYHDASHTILGCKHYRRKAALVAPCCGRVVPCRLCHDEAVSHRMDRYAVSHMVCMECGAQQPVAGSCGSCGTKLARYYCNICHLFDDEPGRHIYHCPFCNVCRRGKGLGIDFFHCMECNSCMSLSLFKTHTCRERAMESNCPVCSEYLFDSADPIKELPCGHLLHSRCFAEYTRYNYTCPLCSKSVGDMSVYFQMLDSLLASERLPPEYAGRMQQVLCNDCGKSGFARFHFAYHACPHCRSYNTRVM